MSHETFVCGRVGSKNLFVVSVDKSLQVMFEWIVGGDLTWDR